MFDHASKHLDVRQKYFAVRLIFNSVLGVWKRGKTRPFVFDILRQILNGVLAICHDVVAAILVSKP